MRIKLFVGLFSLATLATGCKTIPIGIEPQTLEAIQQELDELKGVVGGAVDTLGTVIPGGDWNRLIRDLHGGDPQRRREALRYLESLSGERTQAQYQVTVEFTEFDETSPLHAAIFPAPSPRGIHLLERAKAIDLNDTVEIRKTIREPMTEAEVLDRVGRLVQETIDILGGSRRTNLQGTEVGGGAVVYSVFYDGALNPRGQTPVSGHPNTIAGRRRMAANQLNSYMDQQLARRRDAVEKLKQAIMSVYGSRTTTLGNPGLNEDWDIYSPDQYLFIAIPLDDWEAQEEHPIKIVARLNEKGHLDRTYKDRPPYIFSRDDFEGPLQTERGAFMWARHAMGDTNIFTEKMTDSLADLVKQIEAWDAQE